MRPSCLRLYENEKVVSLGIEVNKYCQQNWHTRNYLQQNKKNVVNKYDGKGKDNYYHNHI